MKPAGEKEFWAKTVKSGDCWTWRGCEKKSVGYGILMRRKISQEPILAHRYAWFLTRGEWPKDGLFVCHHCDNKLCVRPDHLFIGTHADNQRDKIIKGRNKAPVGINHGMAKLTESQVLQIRASKKAVAKLAMQYGISDSTIYAIKSRELWGHL